MRPRFFLSTDVVIKRSSSAEVARLLEALLGPEMVAREAAAARLAVLGARAIDRLVATLPGLTRAMQQTAVLDVLERIGDSRGAAAAEPLMREADEGVAVAAVAVVRRALQAPDAEVAARAADALRDVARDAARPAAVTSAAREALGDLPEDVVRSLRHEWTGVDAPGPPPPGTPSAASAPAQPAAPDEPALDAWLRGSTEAAPDTIRDLLQRAAPASPLPLLHRAVEHLRAVEAAAAPAVADEWRAIRGAMHQTLAERRSLVALYDLREQVEQAPERLTVSMLAALIAVADASCLEPMAAAWERSRDAWTRDQLRAAVAAVIAREGLTRRHAAVRRLAAHHPTLLQTVSTPSRTTPSRRRAGRT